MAEKKSPPGKRKPLGKALPPVTKIAAPTQEEKDTLISLWDTYAPEKYKGMMAAEDSEKLRKAGKRPSGLWIWDRTSRTYTNTKTGYVVDMDEAKAALSAYVRAYSKA